MKIIHSPTSLLSLNTPSQVDAQWHHFTGFGGVLTIGNFDGVHLGHQQILKTARQLASQTQRPMIVLTFDPHPGNLISPQKPRIPIGSLQQRLEIIQTYQPDYIIVMKPSTDYLQITAEDFLRVIIHERLGGGKPVTMVEGDNFTFGFKALGNIALLQTLGPQLGITVQVVPTLTQTLSDWTLVNVSSTLIRWLITQGRVRDAARCLGRPFTLRGQVIKGVQRGRTLGFPTANLQTDLVYPTAGVYAGEAFVRGQRYAAAISVGNNPTFAGQKNSIEAYLLDYPTSEKSQQKFNSEWEFYGDTIDLAFKHFLRDMIPFGGPGPLVKQLQFDVARVRQYG